MRIVGTLAVIAVTAACRASAPPASLSVQPLESPAGAHSLAPQLSGDVLSWIEKRPDGTSRLLFSRFTGGAWSAAAVVAEGRGWFVNWADVPSVAAGTDGSLAAHWLVKSGPETYAYDVNLARSTDGGRTWTRPVLPHRDGVPAEHGFVSVVPGPAGAFDVLLLDGRAMAHGARGATALRATTWTADGMATEQVLDDRVCDCCQTAAVRAGDAIVAIYRDRTEAEVRDISVVRRESGTWSAPQPFGPDQWTIPGCPVNGPSMATSGTEVAAAWYGAPSETAHVKLRRSPDAGRTWSDAVRIDEGKPLGRVDVVAFPGYSLVSWMEGRESGTEILVRRVPVGGAPEPPVTLARTSDARASGFPRLERAGDVVLATWTDTSGESRVRTARIAVQ